LAKAYLVAQIEVHDPLGYDAYRSRTGAIIERFGGRFVVRGGELHLLEGEPDFSRLVVIEFPDSHTARGFYNSAEYQELIPHRTANARSMLLIAEGADG
jgi:uncharacterized protein (DUF1330 family)